MDSSDRPQGARAPALGFTSDNIAGASPEVVEAIAASSAGQASPYGADDLTARVERKLSEIFEREVDVFLVPTGTAANALCLSAMTPPWGNIYCHPASHINNDECGAPASFTNGAKLVAVDGQFARMSPASLRSAARVKVGDVHSTQPSCASITQATEEGGVYTLDEIGALAEVCKASSIKLHMDGSRFANALVSLGCSPAEMTWKAGVDALSFGATKNGVFAAEAIVLFDASLAPEMGYRRKRAGHLFSKMRFLSAQIDAYLSDDLWLRNARQANDAAQRLSRGLAGLGGLGGVEVLGATEANIVFCRLPATAIQALLQAGFGFYHDRWEQNVVRFVTSFSTTIEDVDNLLAHVTRAVVAHQSGNR
ncbi:threonine aldolase [Paraburkholderia caffeinilytica]|uniref:L-threonine aldolase n=1 Tax=Paraburkholderia caffeinilytica TaxID=1761016 RepID=A0ABQ1MNN6_9BURK|nr:low specificity L-threonine aldolase [Paraburkholderia caffeinilytica]AXL50491.1 threonine aldolase [Paraburkholderia caffeinilytica]GGC43774.1 L-threonine aldolase [Paraburkholderia caffeinilytica]CAB3790180.1 Low specificity L-threonine aldolase [Paraburkholderia caffeinilytica]